MMEAGKLDVLWWPTHGDILLLNASLAPIAVLRGHTGAVYDLAWSPEGDQLASLADDGTIIVWQVP